MGLLDSLKAKLAPAKDKVADLAQQHGDKIDHGIEKAAKLVDEKTKGKYSDKIHTGTDKAKDALDRIGHKDDGTPGTGGTAPGNGATPGSEGTGGGAPGSAGTTPPPSA
ncbi:antitoxin [Streptomyces sp. NBC_00691]|uniref:antitoxin n=1 Tax=Streptomyces sp. NBC_00691 TaxID=2903671 RepID=UPI002E35BCD3|nr:antitoxin [Streptomyces sp. NBC_00691]